MSKGLVDLSGNRYEFVNTIDGKTYTIFSKTKEKAEKELKLFLEKIGKSEEFKDIKIC